MHISISERLRPFCHLPGTSTILCGSGYQVQIFPCLIRVFDLKRSRPFLLFELKLLLKGPVEEFTLFNDLEKGRITVSGRTIQGWIRYHIIGSTRNQGFRLLVEKGGSGGMTVEEKGRSYVLQDKEWVDFFQQQQNNELYHPPRCERLSLGNHKAQDWELMKRRFDLTEFLPLLHRLGQLVPVIEEKNRNQGTLSLLNECRESLASDHPEKSEKIWLRFLRGSFHGLLVPQLEDCEFQGIVDSYPQGLEDVSPLLLLSLTSCFIRQFFIRETGQEVSILPHLFPSLHCGRLLNASLANKGEVSLEWTKKTIRRMVLSVQEDQECLLRFPSNVRSYRIRRNTKDKGERVSCKALVDLKANCEYWLDNFE
ncbi:MAG: hypothetical protein ACH350_01060 [Parachlamydiaceae bacterium]